MAGAARMVLQPRSNRERAEQTYTPLQPNVTCAVEPGPRRARRAESAFSPLVPPEAEPTTGRKGVVMSPKSRSVQVEHDVLAVVVDSESHGSHEGRSPVDAAPSKGGDAPVGSLTVTPHEPRSLNREDGPAAAGALVLGIDDRRATARAERAPPLPRL